jgi:hypothetical protein
MSYITQLTSFHLWRVELSLLRMIDCDGIYDILEHAKREGKAYPK